MKPNVSLGAGSLIAIAAGVGLALIANPHPRHSKSIAQQYFRPQASPGDADIVAMKSWDFVPAQAQRGNDSCGTNADRANPVQFASDAAFVADKSSTIPEPATLTLLGTGVLLLLTRQRPAEN